MCANAFDNGSEDLDCIVNCIKEVQKSDGNQTDKIGNWRKQLRRRERQHQLDTKRSPNDNLRSRMIKYRLDTIIAFFCLLLANRICNAREEPVSPLQRPPPPPVGSTFLAQATTNTDDRGKKPQETDSPSPLQYQDDFYSNSGPTEQARWPSDPSSLQGHQNQNPSLPIHYEFPRADGNRNLSLKEEERYQRGMNQKLNDINDDISSVSSSTTSSARKDLITRYWSSKMGKVQIQAVVGLVGYGSGSFLAKSMFGSSDMVRWTGYSWAIFLILSTWFRTPMGELSRAVGLSLILVLQRTQRIRREYPTWRYVAASVGILRGGPRDARGRPRGPRPFPAARNPWNYSPRSPRDPDFNMIFTIVSMALVGSTVGGSLPFIPNWIGALMGAASFAFACTWKNSHRGDLARTMGMRVVRAVTELWEIQADLQIIPKATLVSSHVIDKAMVFDRKHQVKDRFLSFANKSYAQASKVAEQIQTQQRGGEKNDNADKDRMRNRRNYRSTDDYQSEDYDDRKERDERAIDSRKSRRDLGRDADSDRFDEFRDERKRRRQYRDDYSDGNDAYFPDDDPDSNEGRRRRQYEFENDDGVDRHKTSKDYDDANAREQIYENEREKKSKGFFFRRK